MMHALDQIDPRLQILRPVFQMQQTQNLRVQPFAVEFRGTA